MTQEIPTTDATEWTSTDAAEQFADVVESTTLAESSHDAVLVGEPYDGGVDGRPGAREGPAAITAALAELGTHHFDAGPVSSVGDLGSVDVAAGESVTAVQNQIREVAAAVHDSDALPVFFGGDGSLTYANVVPLLTATDGGFVTDGGEEDVGEVEHFDPTGGDESEDERAENEADEEEAADAEDEEAVEEKKEAEDDEEAEDDAESEQAADDSEAADDESAETDADGETVEVEEELIGADESAETDDDGEDGDDGEDESAETGTVEVEEEIITAEPSSTEETAFAAADEGVESDVGADDDSAAEEGTDGEGSEAEDDADQAVDEPASGVDEDSEEGDEDSEEGDEKESADEDDGSAVDTEESEGPGDVETVETATTTGGSVGVVSLDAHLDCRAVDGQPSNRTAYRQLFAAGLDALAVVGARHFESATAEAAYLHDQGGAVVTAEEVGEDPVAAADRALEALEGVDAVYVSVDLDVLDATAAPGVSDPTPGGISTRELFRLLRVLVSDDRLAGVEVVEAAPPLCPDGRTARAGARAVAHALSVAGDADS